MKPLIERHFLVRLAALVGGWILIIWFWIWMWNTIGPPSILSPFFDAPEPDPCVYTTEVVDGKIRLKSTICNTFEERTIDYGSAF